MVKGVGIARGKWLWLLQGGMGGGMKAAMTAFCSWTGPGSLSWLDEATLQPRRMLPLGKLEYPKEENRCVNLWVNAQLAAEEIKIT